MPPRLLTGLSAVLLATKASPALAHGMEGVVQPLVIAAVAVGVIGGIVAGATASNPGGGVLASLGVLFAAVVVYMLIEFQGSADFFGILGMMLILVVFAGAIPLAITFFIAFAAATVVRARIRPEEKRSEPAP